MTKTNPKQQKKKSKSLARGSFRATLLGAVILGFVAFVIGFGLYTYALANRYIANSFGTSRLVSALVTQTVDVEPLAEEVMGIYRGLDETERAKTGSAIYRAQHADIKQREDYKSIERVLRDIQSTADVDFIYLGMYDEATSALVYIVDPDRTETGLFPADWEAVSAKELTKFLNWNEEGMLYDISNTNSYGWICTSGYPVRNEQGQTVAFILADVSLSEVIRGMRSFILQYFIAIVIVIALFVYFRHRFMVKKLIGPLNSITEAAQDYIVDKKAGLKETDHFSSLDIHTGDEVERLVQVMSDMEQDLSTIEEDLVEMTAEKERFGAELSLGFRIQESMLPHIFPPFPDRKEFDLYASMVPAREVGGDFYDFFFVDDDHLCLVMADVSGKGIPAALYMMASKIILANSAKMGISPAEVLANANKSLCADDRSDMFVTVWLGILELSTGKLVAANAGHEYPAILHAGGKFELFKDPHGFVVGGMDGVRYKEYELMIEPGSKLFLYTDGVPEATNAKEELFGTERMVEALNEDTDAAPEEIMKNVRKAVDRFVEDAEQFDDLTMMCFHYHGSKII